MSHNHRFTICPSVYHADIIPLLSILLLPRPPHPPPPPPPPLLQALDAAWPIITNRAVIAVNQQWIGDSGRINSQGGVTQTPNCGHAAPCTQPAWIVFSKALPLTGKDVPTSSRAAVLMMNNDDSTASVSVNLTTVAGLGYCGPDGAACTARDFWTGDSVAISTEIVQVVLNPHECLFIDVVSTHRGPPPSPRPRPPSPGPPAPSTSCRWIHGVGLAGGDVATVEDSPTKEACCSSCVTHPQCKAACFRPQNHTGAGPKGCHLKAEAKPNAGKGDADAVVCIPLSAPEKE